MAFINSKYLPKDEQNNILQAYIDLIERIK